MQPKTGVLLVNLGTPNSPNPKDVKRYLLEFLTDARVIDVPWHIRQFLVRGVIVPRRYCESADAYSQVWTKDGSPLLVYSTHVASLLQNTLGEAYCVDLAMRYQNPSIESILRRFEKQNFQEVIVLPMFPQYASATTGSIHQKVMQIIQQWITIPKITFVNSYFDHPKYISAFCQNVHAFDFEQYDHVILSFHGLPERQLKKADTQSHCLQKKDCCQTLTATNHSCYSAQCYATSHAIAKYLNLQEERYSVTFQSRLGKEPWLQPFTADTVLQLAKDGKKKILIMCPAFTADCLETIHEIGIELKQEFQAAGGEKLDLVPCPNDSKEWVNALATIVKEHRGSCNTQVQLIKAVG